MRQLPEPSFIDRDPNRVTADMVADYEAAAGTVLQPAQPEMLLINQVAYRESLIRIAIQEAAKQSLVRFASYPMLDYLGELVGCERLLEQPARTPLCFVLSEPQNFNVVIPAGTRVESKDGMQIFATNTDLAIPAGEIVGTVASMAETAGIAGNGYLAGEVNSLVAPIASVATVANTATTTGGADAESDDNYRQRIMTAPESFSVAGPKGAYIHLAKSAHQDIVDVAVLSSSPGMVDIYPLTATGQPSQAILDLVGAICNDDAVRPLCDQVNVLAPLRKIFAIAADIILYSWADQATVLAAINTALTTYAAELRRTLGRDVITTRIVALINGVDGVYKTILAEPAADTVNVACEWSDCISISINVVGLNEG